jgi:hypothetical protein
METRLKRLLLDFEWGRMDEIFLRAVVGANPESIAEPVENKRIV